MTDRHACLTIEEAARRLLSIERPLLLTHKNPDGDTVGSAAALCAFFRQLGRRPLYMSEHPLPARLAFLREGEERATSVPDGYTPMAVDVASLAQLGALADILTDTPVALTIDHHAIATPFADTLCLPEACSAGEVIYRVLSHLCETHGLCLSVPVARALYAAISSDTGGFRYSNTTADTHRIAAHLLTFAFDHATIDRRLFESKSEAQLRAEGLTASCLRREGSVTYAVIDREARAAHDLAYDDLDTAIDIVRSLTGTTVAVVAKQTDAGDVKFSLRSTGPDVAAVAAAFGGGGHVRAAGCTLTDEPSVAMRRVLDALHARGVV